jgi:hypothetical protein
VLFRSVDFYSGDYGGKVLILDVADTFSYSSDDSYLISSNLAISLNESVRSADSAVIFTIKFATPIRRKHIGFTPVTRQFGYATIGLFKDSHASRSYFTLDAGMAPVRDFHRSHRP